MAKGSDYYFKAFFSWGAAFDQIPDAEVGRFSKALWSYMRNHVEPENIDGIAGVLWSMAMEDIRKLERDRENGALGWEAKLEKKKKTSEVRGGYNPGEMGVDYSTVNLEKNKNISSCRCREEEINPEDTTTTTLSSILNEFPFTDPIILTELPKLMEEAKEKAGDEGVECLKMAMQSAWKGGAGKKNLAYIEGALRGKLKDLTEPVETVYWRDETLEDWN